MDIEDTGHLAQIRFLIRDRDAKYPALIDKILGLLDPQVRSVGLGFGTPQG
jgi:hypothetical protein